MFDKKQIIHNHHSSQVNINEHRTPTDDSIRLAEEFREKALKDIISKETVRNNTLKWVNCNIDKIKNEIEKS